MEKKKIKIKTWGVMHHTEPAVSEKETAYQPIRRVEILSSDWLFVFFSFVMDENNSYETLLDRNKV